MFETDFEISYIIVCELTGAQLNEKQREILERFKQEHPELYKELSSPYCLKGQTSDADLYSADDGWKKVMQKISAQSKKRTRRRISPGLRQILRYCAIASIPLFLVLSEVKIFALEESLPELLDISLEEMTASTIILDSGDPVPLASGENIVADKYTISYSDSTGIRYDIKSLSRVRDAFNQLNTARSKSCAVTLSDGSSVRLNSFSRLRYPVAFNGKSREIFLEGEAFLEVAKSDIPFVVHTELMDIEVLGTTFNISAYPEEDIEATLVEGSVKVSAADGESITLNPSEQAILNPDRENIVVEKVDTDFYTSWVKGDMNFQDERLEDILDRLSIWYDFSVKYGDKAVKDIRFGCHISHNDDIGKLLLSLQNTNKIKVKKTGDFYYITK